MTLPSAAEALVAFRRRLRDLHDDAVFVDFVADHELAGMIAAIDAQPATEVPLRGMVFAVKDNIDVAGTPTTAACPAFSYTPTRSAPVVDRLVGAGALPVAKSNMDQFATGLVGTRSPHGAPRNPHNPDHVPGGSSSGSAVAVARGLTDFALATDTAGSGRVPAAFCGVVGLKPTFGLVSTLGTVPAVRSADCVSIMAPSVTRAHRILQHAAAFDANDPFGRRPPSANLSRPVDELRLGHVGDAALRSAGADETVIADYRSFIEHAGVAVGATVEVDIAPFLEAGDLLYGGAFVAERAAAVGGFVAAHLDAVDPVVAAIIEGGRDFDAVAAHRTRYRLMELRRECERIMTAVDAFVVPTVPRSALLSDVADDPVGINSELGRFTTFANLVDLCALSVPSGGIDRFGVPLGVTLYAPAFEDDQLALLGDALVVRATTTTLVVAGAHLRGQPLEHQLTGLGANFGGTTTTAPTYRLFALAGTDPPKPGLVFDPGGRAIEVDVWQLTDAALGRFLGLVAAPLALGSVTLADGSTHVGFVCEPRALTAATDISHHGGWRNFVASHG